MYFTGNEKTVTHREILSWDLPCGQKLNLQVSIEKRDTKFGQNEDVIIITNPQDIPEGYRIDTDHYEACMVDVNDKYDSRFAGIAVRNHNGCSLLWETKEGQKCAVTLFRPLGRDHIAWRSALAYFSTMPGKIANRNRYAPVLE